MTVCPGARRLRGCPGRHVWNGCILTEIPRPSRAGPGRAGCGWGPKPRSRASGTDPQHGAGGQSPPGTTPGGEETAGGGHWPRPWEAGMPTWFRLGALPQAQPKPTCVCSQAGGTQDKSLLAPSWAPLVETTNGNSHKQCLSAFCMGQCTQAADGQEVAMQRPRERGQHHTARGGLPGRGSGRISCHPARDSWGGGTADGVHS